MLVKDKKILIIGMARSGISAAKLCYKLGGKVYIYDRKEKANFIEKIKDLEDYPITYYFGEFKESYLIEIDYLILSPGVPTDLDFIIKAREKGITIIGEIELAYQFCKSEILAITGTNGKTTTTSLVGNIIKLYNPNTYVVGNIGNPFTEVVLDTTKDGVVVAEISSFQLETIRDFKPNIAAILNFTEDHLNRHKTYENYIKIKARISENQKESDYLILNYDDEICRSLNSKVRSKVIWFSMNEEVEGVYLKDNIININMNGIKEKIITTSDVKILGKHNIENIMAAIAICICKKIPIDIIKKGILNFKGVEHRLEYVCTINDVKYYNDSKATNPDAAIKGIQSMVTPTVLIAGGMDKGNNFDEWIDSFDKKVKALVVYGETADKIKKTVLNKKKINVFKVQNLEKAVIKAKELANAGDSVLLSPACASWDMFKSYEERGNLYKKLVTTL